MKLLSYQVENFRSVENSGWIDCDDVTTLVGINESGKSNLLLALWKLNPAREGGIDLLHDLPVSKLSTLRKDAENVKFISAKFILGEESARIISESTGAKCNSETTVIVSRYYDGLYSIEYPDGCPSYNNEAEEEEDFDEDAYKQSLTDAIINEIPKFVYYSNYGNLSTKIYLPNVIKWLKGETVSGIEANEDQVRTLRVLFDFVKLDPQEILDLGKDPKILAMERNSNRSVTPTPEEIAKAENDKEERSILLQSASGELTRQFREWWKQGEYKFRFEARFPPER